MITQTHLESICPGDTVKVCANFGQRLLDGAILLVTRIKKDDNGWNKIHTYVPDKYHDNDANYLTVPPGLALANKREIYFFPNEILQIVSRGSNYYRKQHESSQN